MNIGANFFSDTIEKVIKNASRIALRFGSDVVGTEHILYGITSVKDCLASKALAEYGVTEEDLFELFEENSFEEPAYGAVELSPRVKDLFRIAQQIALEYGNSFLGTEHLLLAILSSSGSVALKLLTNHYGVNIQSLFDKLASSLSVAQNSTSQKTRQRCSKESCREG